MTSTHSVGSSFSSMLLPSGLQQAMSRWTGRTLMQSAALISAAAVVHRLAFARIRDLAERSTSYFTASPSPYLYTFFAGLLTGTVNAALAKLTPFPVHPVALVALSAALTAIHHFSYKPAAADAPPPKKVGTPSPLNASRNRSFSRSSEELHRKPPLSPHPETPLNEPVDSAEPARRARSLSGTLGTSPPHSPRTNTSRSVTPSPVGSPFLAELTKSDSESDGSNFDSEEKHPSATSSVQGSLNADDSQASGHRSELSSSADDLGLAELFEPSIPEAGVDQPPTSPEISLNLPPASFTPPTESTPRSPHMDSEPPPADASKSISSNPLATAQRGIEPELDHPPTPPSQIGSSPGSPNHSPRLSPRATLERSTDRLTEAHQPETESETAPTQTRLNSSKDGLDYDRESDPESENEPETVLSRSQETALRQKIEQTSTASLLDPLALAASLKIPAQSGTEDELKAHASQISSSATSPVSSPPSSPSTPPPAQPDELPLDRSNDALPEVNHIPVPEPLTADTLSRTEQDQYPIPPTDPPPPTPTPAAPPPEEKDTLAVVKEKWKSLWN